MIKTVLFTAVLYFVLSGVFSYQKVVASRSQVSPVTQLIDYGGLATFDPEFKKKWVIYKRSYRFGPDDNESRIEKGIIRVRDQQDKLIHDYQDTLNKLQAINTWDRIKEDTVKFARMIYSEMKLLFTTRLEFRESVRNIIAAIREPDPDSQDRLLTAYIDDQRPIVREFLNGDPLMENVGLKPLKEKVDSAFQRKTSSLVRDVNLNFMLLNAPHKELLQEQKNVDINRQMEEQRYRNSRPDIARRDTENLNRMRKDQQEAHKFRQEILKQRIDSMRRNLRGRR